MAGLGAVPAEAQRIPTAPADLPRYDIRVAYDASRPSVSVSGTVVLPPVGYERREIQLSLAEAMGDARFTLLDASGNPVASRSAKHLRPYGTRTGWGTNSWIIRPERPLSGGRPVTVRFSYEVASEFAANLVYSGPRMAFGSGVLTAWYPELEREPVGQDGALRGLRGTGRIAFTAPPGFVAYANGRAVQGARATFDFDRPVFFAFAIAPYRVTRREGPVPVLAYELHDRPASAAMLEKVDRIVRLLSDEFYPYPHSEFAVVEVPNDLAQRAGFEGACLEGFIYSTTDFIDRPFSTAFFGHELGHMWWPYMLGPDAGNGNYLLTDAMVQYASLRAVEEIEGEAAAERYRRVGYPRFFPEFSGTGYLQLVVAGYDMPLSQSYPPAHPSGRISFSLVGSKGMLVWYMLSEQMGRERFRQVMRRLIQENFQQRLPIPEFRRRFNVAAGSDWSWFFDQWFDRQGAPELRLEWTRRGNRILGTVRQQGEPYRLRVPIAIRTARGVEERLIDVSGPSTSFAFDIAGRVQSVELDPRFEILRWTDAYRAEAEALVDYTKGTLAFSSGGPDRAIPLFREGLARPRPQDPFSATFMLHYGLADALFWGDQLDEAYRETQAALAIPTTRRDIVAQLYLIQARIAHRRGDRSALQQAIRAVIEADAAAGGMTGTPEQARALLRN